ncbi:MAG TPA: S4 domain-containing protein [Steroidobacteraceae bacterium]|nr:S4 domain-containing protein [Steroidobacteraceae bacterium]
MSERLHKVLAQHGYGSRRELEQWMAQGRVLLNGRPAEAGARYESGDKVVVDGRDISSRLQQTARPTVLIYHKPHDQLLDAREAKERGDLKETVLEQLPAVRGARWQAINVMHAGDSGLMLFTNDGRLGDALRRHLERIPARYSVRVLMPDTTRFLELNPTSVQLDEEQVTFTSVETAGGEGSNRWFDVELPRADRRTAARALFESHGYKVSRVIQTSFGPIGLPRDVPRGRHRELEVAVVCSLYELAQLPVPEELKTPVRAASGRGRKHTRDARNTSRKKTINRRDRKRK